VTDEAGRARVAPQDLGPLVPAARPPIGQAVVEELERALLLAEADERAHVAQLVRRVLVPVRVAAPPRLELRPVTVVGPRQRRRREVPDLAAGRGRDAGRGRARARELRRARAVVDTVLR